MSKLKAIVEISRPVNFLMTFVVVLVSAFISSEIKITAGVILASLSAAIVAASGNVINDYFDLNIDKINKPERPIPSGRISKSQAVLIYLLLVITSIILASFISFSSLLIVLITTLLLFLYSLKLKGIPFIGNIVVALCTGLAFIFGGIAVNNPQAAIIPTIFAFLVNLIREIVKDTEDMEGDKIYHQNTIPLKYGLGRAKFILVILVVILIVSTLYPFVYQIYKIEYFIFVLFFVNLPLSYLIKLILSKDFFAKLAAISLSLKVIMIFGLIAIFLGVY